MPPTVRGPKKPRVAPPKTHEEWKAFKKNDILGTRKLRGEHQHDYCAVARFYRSQEAVSYTHLTLPTIYSV